MDSIKLFVRVFARNNRTEGQIIVPNLEISIDMLKRCIYQDSRTVATLDLPKMAMITIGQVIEDPLTKKEIFKSFPSTESLKNAGLMEDSVVWIFIQEQGSSKENLSI